MAGKSWSISSNGGRHGPARDLDGDSASKLLGQLLAADPGSVRRDDLLDMAERAGFKSNGNRIKVHGDWVDVDVFMTDGGGVNAAAAEEWLSQAEQDIAAFDNYHTSWDSVNQCWVEHFD